MKPTLTEKQKESFKKDFLKLIKSPDAKEASIEWNGQIEWIPNVDTPMLPGFNPEKLRRRAADDFNKLLLRVANRTI